MKTSLAGRARGHLLVALLTTLGWSGRAYAQRGAPRQGPCANATGSIEIAVREREAGHSEAALAVLEDLHGRCPTPQVSAQLALAESDTRRYGAAWAHLQAALAEPDDPWVRSRRAALLVARTELRRHMATIAVRPALADAELFVDGERLGPASAPEPYVVGPGERRVEVRGPGLATTARVVVAAEGEAVVVEAPAPAPVVVEAPSTPAAPPAAPRTPAVRYVGYGLLGVGAAAAVVGVVFAVLTATQADALRGATSLSAGPEGAFVRFVTAPGYTAADRSSDTACLVAAVDPSADGRAVDDLCTSHQRSRTLAWALGLGGAAAAGVGVALVLLRPGGSSHAAALRVSPMLGNTTGVVVHGTF